MEKNNGSLLKNKIAIMIIAVILTATLTFFVTQQFYSQKLNSVISNLQSEINTLSNSNRDLTSKYDDAKKELVKEKQFSRLLTDHIVYKSKYYDEIDAISESMKKINATYDYTTCKLNVDKSRELHKMFNDDELETGKFLSKIAEYTNKSACFNKINEYDAARTDVINSRKKYNDAFENWCYGYHKVDWSSTWVEEYLTPWTIASDKLSESEKKIGIIYNQAIQLCLTN